MSKIMAQRRSKRRNDSGYMLLFLMLAVAVLTITMLGVARNYRRGIQRDREVEMIHRGEQYSRAVRRFYRRYHNYPTSIEQLQSSNNLRFLRKKYKDPMSPDGEWKLVHSTDITLRPGGVSATAGTATGAATNPASSGSAFGNASAANQNTSANQSTDSSSAIGTNPTGTTAGTNNPAQGLGSAGNTINSVGATGTNDSATTQVMGGGPLLGVVSKQVTEGIHSFGDKKKYSEWFFIYDPSQDKGMGPVGPYNPKMFIGSAGSGLGNNNKGTSGSGTTAAPNSASPTTPSATTPNSMPSTTAPPPATP